MSNPPPVEPPMAQWGSPTSSQTTLPTTTGASTIPAHISVPSPQQPQQYHAPPPYYPSQGYPSQSPHPYPQHGYPQPAPGATGGVLPHHPLPQHATGYPPNGTPHHPQHSPQPQFPAPPPQNYQQQQQQQQPPSQPYVTSTARPPPSDPSSSNNNAATTTTNDVQERKLRLLQEQINVDRELFTQEKKTWKKRLRAAKLKITESQKNYKNAQKKRSLEWAALQHENDRYVKEQILTVEQNSQKQIAQMKEQLQQQDIAFRKERTLLETNLTSVTQDLEQLQTQFQKHKELSVAKSSHPDAKQQQEKIEQLQKELEDKDFQISSLEMQLLEADRNTADLGNSLSSQLDLCGNCASTERRLADAQLQIDTLSNRQFVLDNKLTNERLAYEKLEKKYQAILVEHEECANANEKRLALQATIRTLQDQIVELQISNETLEARIEEMTEQHDSMETEWTKTRALHQEALAKQQTLHDTVTSTQRKLEALQKLHTSHVRTKNDDEIDETEDLSVTLARIQVYEKEWTTDPTYVGLYTGEWRNDAPDGSGTLRLDDGAVYDGRWKDGKPHGRGVWASIDGDLYHGEWRNGRKHGSLVEVTADGRVYRGSYKEDLMDGTGVLTWPYGAYYIGSFVADKRTGKGIYYYADGDRKYEGDYVDDRPHGYGVMTKTADGTILYDGMWELGEFLGSDTTVEAPRGTETFDPEEEDLGDLEEEDDDDSSHPDE